MHYGILKKQQHEIQIRTRCLDFEEKEKSLPVRCIKFNYHCKIKKGIGLFALLEKIRNHTCGIRWLTEPVRNMIKNGIKMNCFLQKTKVGEDSDVAKSNKTSFPVITQSFR